MSRRKAKGVPRPTGLPKNIEDEHVFLLAFMDTMEQQRLKGEVLAWSVRTWSVKSGEAPYQLIVLAFDGTMFDGRAWTWKEAHAQLVERMIEKGLGELHQPEDGKFPEGGIAFTCVGCGQPAFYFPIGVPNQLPPGAVGHSKPAGRLRSSPDEPSRVDCDLYKRVSPEEFWELNKTQPRLEEPTAFKRADMSN